jgi:hypothetical protein
MPRLYDTFTILWHALGNAHGVDVWSTNSPDCPSNNHAYRLQYALEPDDSWAEALLIGAVLSATDPTAVVALMESHATPPQIVTLLEGESLLNDGFGKCVLPDLSHLDPRLRPFRMRGKKKQCPPSYTTLFVWGGLGSGLE